MTTYYRLLIVLPQLTTSYCDNLGTYYDVLPEGATAEDSPTIAEAFDLVRSHRDALLLNTDYTQLDDAPLTPAQKEAYRDYRQALRDYPATIDTTTWSAPPWPEKPV